MNVQGDLRHVENYESQANLTPEQRSWSESWDLLKRLQMGRGKLRYGFAGLVPSGKRVTTSLSDEFIPADNVVCVTMLPMLAARSTRFHKKNRPVRLQVTVSRFHRDSETGQAVLGGGLSHTVFECDGAKHPTQDHPMVRVIDYDPRRGEKEERYGLELFGQSASDRNPLTIIAPTDGIFVSGDQIMEGWIVFLLDGLPAYRFPAGCAEYITVLTEEGSVVEAGDQLACICGNESFLYNRTVYENGKPDMDDDRVLSPLRGDMTVQVDDLYANVYVSQGQRDILVARFHADDVASGKVKLTAEREVSGTGKYVRARNLSGSYNRVKLRIGDEWKSLVNGSDDGEEYMIARLVSPVEYGLAEFHLDGRPVWDRVNFTHDIMPVSRPDCQMPLRMVGKMLAVARRLVYHRPGDPLYPKFHSLEETWPIPYAVFTQTQLEEAGFQSEFSLSPELQMAIRMAVSPKGNFAIQFAKEGYWACTGFDDDMYPTSRVLYFKPCCDVFVKVDSEEEKLPIEIELGARPWKDKENSEVAAMAEREANGGEDEPVEEDTDGVISVLVPKGVAVRKDVFDGDVVTKGDDIADWVPRQFYTWEQLEGLLDNNVPWFVNEYLRAIAIPRDDQTFLLPEAYVAAIVSPDQGLVLKRGTHCILEDSVAMFTPLDLWKRREMFTWSVNRIFYDVTPPHLVGAEESPTKKKRRRRSKQSQQEERKQN